MNKLLLLIGKKCIGNRLGRIEPRAIKKVTTHHPTNQTKKLLQSKHEKS